MNSITGRILRKIGDPDLVEKIVTSLSLSEIQSLMMEIIDEKRKGIRLNEILDQYESDGFVRPSTLDPQIRSAFDEIAVSSLSDDYRVLELSPVSPLGCCSQVAGMSQDRIVSTVRRNEVCSDPTNVLALEASLLRKRENLTARLAASQRVLRAERPTDAASFSHFRLFCACIAGRDGGDYLFETTSAVEIISFYRRLLRALAARGCSFSGAGMTVKFREKSRLEKFSAAVGPDLSGSEDFAIGLEVDGDENWNYYRSMRMNLFVRKDGETYFVADAGDTDWTQKLLNNRKERFFISGFGSERFLSVFGDGLRRA